MKYFAFIIGLFFHIATFSQNSNSPTEVTPAIEKSIKQEIEKTIPKLKQEMKKSQQTYLAIEFAVDTFRIEGYMEKYIGYDYSTAGMSSATYKAAQGYDSLLNKYYKKLLAVLKEGDKKILIQAQKNWIVFRDSELKLIETVSKDEYSGGGTMQQLIDASSYLAIIQNRTIDIFEYLKKVTQDY